MQKKLKHKIANYIFHREFKHHERNYHSLSFEEAKTIGIVYDATKDEDFEVVKNYVKEIRSHHKEVSTMGFVDARELPATRFAKLGLDFFTRKDMDWKMRPQNPFVNNFINAGFDIFINLNIYKRVPLKYLAAITKAKFKIGMYEKKNIAFCDLMISTDAHVSLKDFIQQVNHYLKLIKNEPAYS